MNETFPIVRIQKLELKNFKNVSSGTISMPSHLQKDRFEYKSDILGIYGQNGTGKSAVIEAFELIRLLFAGDSITQEKAHCHDYERYIAKGQQDCSLALSVLIESKAFKSKVDYAVTLTRRDEDAPKPVVIAQESLHSAEWDSEKKRFSRRELLYSYDSSRYDSFLPKICHEVLVDKQENQLDVAVAIALAQTQGHSILMSSRMQAHFESTRKDKKIIIVNRLCCVSLALKLFTYCNFFVTTNMHCLVSQSHLGVSFYTKKLKQAPFLPENFAISLEQTDLISRERCELAQTCIASINTVLQAIIPQLQIKLHQHGEEINSKGETQVRVQLLSVRDGRELPLQDESSGIIKIISLLSHLLQIYHEPSACLIVDELDSGIFEYLLGELLHIFQHEAKGQLLFTSHNLRALEVLKKGSIMFSTSNPEKRYIRMKGIRPNNNLRDMYYRTILLGGQDEELYAETDSSEMARAFRNAGKKL